MRWGTLTTHDEQVKRWTNHFDTVPSTITLGKVPSVVEEMGTHRIMRIRITFPNKREIIAIINAYWRDRTARFDGFPAEPFINTPAEFGGLFLLFICKCCEIKIFPREWKQDPERVTFINYEKAFNSVNRALECFKQEEHYRHANSYYNSDICWSQ